MDVRVVCLCLFILGFNWCCSARELAAPDYLNKGTDELSVLLTNNLQLQQVQPFKEVSSNENLCSLCEQYTGEALGYLANNKTQTKIIDILHKSCLKMPIYRHECFTLVDQYAPIFFSEINTIKPEELCIKVDFCQEVVSISQTYSKESCDLCHQVVTEALLKLKDSDTQLEVLELLLKACKSVKNYAKKCERLVFEYAPLILINAEQFLEKNDVCTMLHACEPAAHKEHALPSMQIPLHSAS